MYQRNRLKGFRNDYLMLFGYQKQHDVVPEYGIQLTGAGRGRLKCFSLQRNKVAHEDVIRGVHGDYWVYPYSHHPVARNGEAILIDGVRYSIIQSVLSRNSDKSVLGEGSFGTVYSACDSEGQLVAIKVYPNEAMWQQERSNNHWLNRQTAPVGFLTSIHDGVLHYRGRRVYATVYDQGIGQVHYMAQMPLENLIGELKQLVEALAWLHAKGRYHGDIKHDNLIFSPDHGAAFIDFGLLGDELERVPNPSYRCPDFKAGNQSDKTEIMALGVCFYRIFSGHYHFSQVNSGHVAEPVYQARPVVTDWGSCYLLSRDELRRLELGIYCREFLPFQKRGLDRLFQVIQSMVSLDARQRPSAEQLVQSLTYLQEQLL